jgi:hypothetical protein
VPVCKQVTCQVTKHVPCWSEESRKVCHKVTCYEDRVVNKTCYKTVQETCMQKQLVRLGHWECREVQPLFGGGGGGLFSGHGHGCCSNSCDPCANSCAPACTRTKKCWVHCPEYRECPVTVCKKVPYCEQVHCKVAVCKNEWREEKVKVCKMQCVTENVTRNVTCYETRQVACKATRTVRVCVPHEETVTCCKMVPRTVCRQVPCAPACAPACPTSCNDCCERAGLLSRIRERHSHDCGRSSCCN